MAYDEALAERIREALAGVADAAEIKMFGGLCYTDRTLQGWVDRGVAHAKSLPPKKPKKSNP